jgi:hypothetical protein
MTETPETIVLKANASRLTLDAQGKLAFRLQGQQLWQAGTLCVLHYYDRQHPRAQQVLVPWDDAQAYGTMGTLSLSTRSLLAISPVDERTARVTMTFDTLHIRIVLTVALTPSGDGFDVSIAPDGVSEGLPRLYRLLGLELLPEFGAARTGEKGYLTLPNWYGCQMVFDKTYPREVRQTIYSSNDQWEHMCNAPVFGITREQGTLCGLIAQGDYDAQLVSRCHWEAAQSNSVHPHLVWRWEQQDEAIAGPRQVRYRFAPPVSSQGEGYAFVGWQYRQFLRQDRGLQTWDEKGKTRPEALDYAGRFVLKIFMAYKDPHPEGKGPYHCTCTCDEARDILQQCLSRGMKKLTAILVGWGQDGHDGKCPTYLPVDERVGGEAGMKALIAWGQAHDILVAVHTSHSGAYACSEEFDVNDLVRHRTGEYWESIVWSGGQAHKVCPKVSLEKHVKRDLPALATLGLHGHHHFDAVGGFVPCYSPLHPVPLRAQYIDLARQEFQVALDVMGSVSTEMPFGQYFDVVDGFWHSHSRIGAYLRNCAVGRHFLDRIVPLVGIALHGSVKCGESIGSGDQHLRMLELLDLGLSPQYEVCRRPSPAFGIPTYERSAQILEDAYRFAFGPEGYVGRLERFSIEGRWELAPKVNRTLYSDGTAVLVNLGDSDFDGLPARSYRFTERA